MADSSRYMVQRAIFTLYASWLYGQEPYHQKWLCNLNLQTRTMTHFSNVGYVAGVAEPVLFFLWHCLFHKWDKPTLATFLIMLSQPKTKTKTWQRFITGFALSVHCFTPVNPFQKENIWTLLFSPSPSNYRIGWNSEFYEKCGCSAWNFIWQRSWQDLCRIAEFFFFWPQDRCPELHQSDPLRIPVSQFHHNFILNTIWNTFNSSQCGII